jgi:CxC4 like cysteine cluster associated with KDZ transposases
VSHLPVPPPDWCRIAEDKGEGEKSWNGGKHVLERKEPFRLGDTARCSCGNVDRCDQPISVQDIYIYTRHGVLVEKIEVSYCIRCPKKRGFLGPDLSDFSIFNWDNTIAFSHEILNEYTNQYTLSETPFRAYCESLARFYRTGGSVRSFLDPRTFQNAWFSFISLQKLSTVRPFSCIACGESPDLVIADGVSLSFRADRIKPELNPPTHTTVNGDMIRITRYATALLNTSGSEGARKKLVDYIKYPEAASGVYDVLNEVRDPMTDCMAHN